MAAAKMSAASAPFSPVRVFPAYSGCHTARNTKKAAGSTAAFFVRFSLI